MSLSKLLPSRLKRHALKARWDPIQMAQQCMQTSQGNHQWIKLRDLSKKNLFKMNHAKIKLLTWLISLQAELKSLLRLTIPVFIKHSSELLKASLAAVPIPPSQVPSLSIPLTSLMARILKNASLRHQPVTRTHIKRTCKQWNSTTSMQSLQWIKWVRESTQVGRKSHLEVKKKI